MRGVILELGREEPSFIAEASFVKAPLNSRVGPSTSVPNVKGKGKQESLDRLPLEIQESLVLEDLLFVLMVCTSLNRDCYTGNDSFPSRHE